MPTVILVQEDPAGLARALARRHFVVRSMTTAVEAVRWVADNADDEPDVIILGLGLPDVDDCMAVRLLRAVTDVPVIVAGRDDETNAVNALDAGADDYVTSPVVVELLVARIAALLRWVGRLRGTGQHAVLEVGGLRVDPRQRVAHLDGRDLGLNRREFDLLAYMAARPGSVVTRRDLRSAVWPEDAGSRETIDAHVSWLRRKLGDSAASPGYLHTIRGVGLRLVAPE